MNFTPQEKADKGMFLSLRELAPLIGFSRKVASAISKQPGFPMLAGKVRYQEFLAWYRRQSASAASDTLPPSQPDADTSDAPTRSNGSRSIVPRVPARRYVQSGEV